MFESSLLSARSARDARVVRAIIAGSVALEAAALGAFTLCPLLYPDTLPGLLQPPRLTRVELLRPRPVSVPPTRVLSTKLTRPDVITAPAHSTPAVLEVRRGGNVTRTAPAVLDQEPALTLGGGNLMASTFSALSGDGARFGSTSSPNVVSAAPRPSSAPATVRVSSGVLRGLLLAPIVPVYPSIARAARVEGTVTVTAVIDRTGHIVNAEVAGGPAMLRDAAITAVRGARYQPYLLNGQPTEVVTTISVTFHMSA